MTQLSEIHGKSSVLLHLSPFTSSSVTVFLQQQSQLCFGSLQTGNTGDSTVRWVQRRCREFTCQNYLQNVSSNFAGTGKSRASSSVMFPWIKWTNNMDPVHPTIKTDPLLWCCSMPFGMNSCSFPSSLLFHIQNLGFCWLSKKMSHQGGNLVRVCWLPPHVSITQQRLNKGVSLSPVSARPQKPNDLPPRLPRWKTNKPFRTGNTPHFQT